MLSFILELKNRKMKHFVIKDIDPLKAKKPDLFLKEMNDLAVLISVAEAPYIDANDLVFNEDKSSCQLRAEAGDFEAKFKAKIEDGNIVNGQFDLFEDGKTIASIFHSVRDEQPIDLRVKLNCEGADLARSELIDNFERDFSYEAHVAMETPLEELQPKNIEEEIDPVDFERDEIPQEMEEDPIETFKENNDPDIYEEDITDLSDRVKQSLKDAEAMLEELSALCYDLTRGKTKPFAGLPLNKETLANGAEVEFFDQDEEGYQVTFRKGRLGELSEISFYFEKDGDLIFNLYFSSAGSGKIIVGSNQQEVVLKRVKDKII